MSWSSENRSLRACPGIAAQQQELRSMRLSPLSLACGTGELLGLCVSHLNQRQGQCEDRSGCWQGRRRGKPHTQLWGRFLQRTGVGALDGLRLHRPVRKQDGVMGVRSAFRIGT